MARYKQPIQDILTQLGTLDVVNQDNQTVKLFARIFNDQYTKLKKGELEAFPLPSALLQIISPTNMKRIGFGVDAGDITFRIHIAHEHLDSGDGTMEQDLIIFDIVDAVVNLLSDYQPTGCSPLMCVNDEPDNEHTNLYVYKIDFVCHYLDNRGVKDKYNLTQLTDAIVERVAPEDVTIDEPVQTITQAHRTYNI